MFIIKWFLIFIRKRKEATLPDELQTTNYKQYLDLVKNDGLIKYVSKPLSDTININIDLSYLTILPVRVNSKIWSHSFEKKDGYKVLIKCIKAHMYPSISDKPFLTNAQVKELKTAFNKKLDFKLKLDTFKINVTFDR